MKRHVINAAILLMGLVSSTTALAEVLEQSPARTTVARWLAAFRAQDDATLAALSDRPLVIDGVDMSTGPERDQCTRLADHRRGARTLRSVAADQAGLGSAIGCLRRDEVFIDTLPQTPPDAWPKTASRGRTSGAVASLAQIAPAKLPPRLRKYQTQIKAFKAVVTLVHLFATDNNGITVQAVVVVSKETTPRVKALFISTRFQE